MPLRATDPRLVLLAEEDNCLVACVDLPEGTEIELETGSVRLPKTIFLGHKLARKDLFRGEKIIKYGAIIGRLVADAAKGEHVHTHNLVSDYLPTYTLETGATYVGGH